jgi:TonB family protein
MKEENWYKMFVIALLLHVVLIAAFGIPLRKAAKRIDLSYYSVNLVTDVGGGMDRAEKESRIRPTEKVAPPTPAKKIETKEPAKAKPVLQPKEKERSIAPTKEKIPTPQKAAPQKKETPRPQSASTDEVNTLDEKIREMRKRTQYMDVGGGGEGATNKAAGDSGLPTSAAGGSRPLDPALQKYYSDVWEKIREAWRPPGLSAKKNLETVVSIRVRKDGRIMDWQIEQRSGDRVFDESVSRTLRAVDLLPPIPASLNLSDLEIGFNFHP